MAELLHLTHDANDFSEYVVTPTGTRITTSASAGLNGTAAGVQFDTAGSSGTDARVNPSFGALETIVRIGWYFDKNTLSITTGYSEYLEVSSGGFNPLLQVRINDVSGLNMRFRTNDDLGSEYLINWGSISSGERKIEVIIEKAVTSGSSDGIITVFVDTIQVGQITGIDNYDLMNDLVTVTELNLRDTSLGTQSGIFYFDEIIIRDDSTPIFPGAFSGYDLVLGGGQL